MVTEQKTYLELFKEHCAFCPDSLFAVAEALLSVESDLDFVLRSELEYLLSSYVVAVAKESPEGLSSILNKFPLTDSSSNVQEAAEALYEKISSLDIPNDIKDKAKELTEAKEVRKQVEDAKKDIKKNNKNNKDNNDDNDTKNDKDPKDKDDKDSKEEDDNPGYHGKKKRFNVKASMKESLMMEAAKNNIPPSDLRGQEDFITEAKVIRLSDSDGDGSIWNVRMIVSGHTQSGRYFPDSVLQEAMPLFEGARSYVNHPAEDYNGGDRPINTLVGWYENVTLKEGDGLYADWHILTNSGVPWLKPLLLELSDEGKLDLIGLSLLGLGKSTFKKQDGKVVKYSEGISYVRSVDLVDIPGAGGKVIENLKESDDNKVRSELMSLEGMTIEELKESNPELYGEILKLGTPVSVVDDPPASGVQEKIDNTSSNQDTQLTEAIHRLEVREHNSILADALRESNLPQPMKEALKKQYGDRVFKQSELDSQIEMYRESASAMVPGYMSGGIPTEENTFRLPASAQIITSEEKMQAAMDRLFGLEIDEQYADVPRLSGIKEAYVAVTNDYEFTWGAIPLDDRIREGAGSTPTAAKIVGGSTVTFANVLGTSMNRRLIRQYKRQNMWWEPFTTIISLNDLKQQDRNRMESLGSLSERTTAGAEYAELTWAEFVHTYTPTEYGNLVPIAQRAVVNDDLSALVRVSDEMGRSAGITLNEYVSNLFTQNSGDGPVFIDVDQSGNTESASENVFDGSTTAVHNNRITSALNRTSFNDAANRIRTMLDKSTKRIGLEERSLLVPVELREVALQLQRSSQVPDSANNAVNIFSGTFQTIVVPQFTDTNNWYLMSSPDQIDMLEMGFLNGRREPEMFVQSDPTAGMHFTHDVIAYKIRHRYGGGWIDYRGSVASIVS